MPSPLARRPVSAALIGQLLDDPDLPARVRSLPVPALRRAIHQVGLEDAGWLVELASPEQLRELFDEDLWRSAGPGSDEGFDAPRFALWLEVLLEAGDAVVAERLARLSEDFLAFAFAQLVRVIDTAAVMAGTLADDDATGALDRLLDFALCQELDEYLIVSRVEHGWDAVWASLLALDEGHAALLRAVLERCWRATQEQVDRAGGLHAALSDDEQLLEDARAERDARRSRLGYVSPADARAFLALARETGDPFAPDPIARAYFRELEREPAPQGARAPSGGRTQPVPLRPLLHAAGADTAPQRALPQERSPLLRRLMQELADADPQAHQRIASELLFLANALLAGDASQRWQPAEAAERALSLCDAGLRQLLAQQPGGGEAGAARRLLVDTGAVGLFRVAFPG